MKTAHTTQYITRRAFSDRGSFADAFVGSNPMFPQRPVPPPPVDPIHLHGQNKKDGKGEGRGGGGGGEEEGPNGPKDGFAEDFEESFVSKHAGLIGWSALLLTTGMLYSYYKSYRSRVEKTEEIIAQQLVEPHEINEIRFGSKGIDEIVFGEIVQSCVSEWGSRASQGMQETEIRAGADMAAALIPITYSEFTAFVIPILKSKNAILKGGHILDRCVETYVMGKNMASTSTNTSTTGSGNGKAQSMFDFSDFFPSGSSNGDGDKEEDKQQQQREHVDISSTEVPLGFLLTALSMSMQSPAQERADVIFDIASASANANGINSVSSPSTVTTTTTTTDDVDSPLPLPPLPTVNFIPSPDFIGAKSSYVFKNGDKGTGYYLDIYGRQLLVERLEVERVERIVRKRREDKRIKKSSSSGRNLLKAKVEGKEVSTSGTRRDDGTGTYIEPSTDLIPLGNVILAIQYLIETYQIPPEKQVISTGIKYPVEKFRNRTAEDMLNMWRKDSSKPKAHVENMLTRDEFRELILGPDVCAWGECWRRRAGAG